MTEILIIRIIILIRTVTISILIIIERIRTRIIKNINRNHNTKIIIRIAVIWTAFHPEKVDRLVFICHYIGPYFYSILLKKLLPTVGMILGVSLQPRKTNCRKLKKLP